MRRITQSLLVGVVALALSGCAGLIPDLSVGNAFGVAGVPVELTADGVGTAATRSQATSFSGLIAATFTIDFDAPFVIPVGPSSISEDIGIAATVTVAGDPADLPATFDVTAATLSLAIAPAAGGANLFEATFVGSPSVTFAKDDGCGATSCTYSATGSDTTLIDAQVTGSEATALLELLTNGGTYQVTGTLSVDVAPAVAATSITVMITTSEGTISF